MCLTFVDQHVAGAGAEERTVPVHRSTGSRDARHLGASKRLAGVVFWVAVCVIVAPADWTLVAAGAATQESCAKIVRSGLSDCETRQACEEWTKHANLPKDEACQAVE